MTRMSSQTLLRAIQNPTKLNVIVLLTDREAMTVTQMAKIVKVSRANLYHFVSEMVDEGLLLGPESRVRRNYVEKYYRLNEKLFEGGDEAEWQATVKGAGPEAFRDLMYSLLVSLSTQFRIMAEQLEGADAATMAKLAEMREKRLVIGSYGILPDEEYAEVAKELKELLVGYEKRSGRTHSTRGKNKVVILAMPGLPLRSSA